MVKLVTFTKTGKFPNFVKLFDGSLGEKYFPQPHSGTTEKSITTVNEN